MIASRSVSRNAAIRTTQFYLLWGILFINVTAGIGILAQASPMMQDMFGRTPLEAGAVVSLISIFNAGGRFAWASASDYIGRRNTYTIFFLAQLALFLVIPGLAAAGQWWLFQASLFLVFTAGLAVSATTVISTLGAAYSGWGELLAFLHAIARDPTVADDAWSVLAAAIWRSLGGFAGRSSLRTWLYVLARHFPARARALPPEAMLAIANCQVELKDTKGARKTIGEIRRLLEDAGAVSYTHLTLPTSDLV